VERVVSRCAEKSRIEKCFKKCVERCAERRADRQEGCAEACKAAAARALAREIALASLEEAVKWLRKNLGLDLAQAAVAAYAGIIADGRERLPKDCAVRELNATAAAVAAAVLAEVAGRRELRLLAAIAASMLEGCEEELERLLDAARKFGGYTEEEIARISSALEERALVVAGVTVRL
jgi:alkylhydroperoxidase/carboxymuconolactone decarboxylase family protein YurZ